MSSIKRRNADRLASAKHFRAGASVTDVTIFGYLSALGTPRALSVWLLYSNGEHDQLLDLKCHVNDYLDGYRYRCDYLATEYLSKSTFLSTSFDKTAAAYSKFFEFEALCHDTNRRFLNPRLDSKSYESSAWLLSATKRKITLILNDLSADELFQGGNWGPGVST